MLVLVEATKALTLSIVIPAYNEKRHLRACLEAIQGQTIAPNEVIVVNNNSSDETAMIARSFPFVTLIDEPQQGIVFARNKGFNAVSSDLIGRIDADTILPPTWVRQIKAFYAEPAHANQAFTGGGYFYNIRAKRFVSWWFNQIAYRTNRLLMGHYITWGSNMVLPRKVWDEVKADTCLDTEIHEDLDLAIHLHRRGIPIQYKEAIKVGVKMRRVRSDLKSLWGNMIWWPRTLKRHGLNTWVFGWIGAVFMMAFVPLAYLAESISRSLGRGKLDE